MGDRIELRGIRAVGIVGVNPEERDRAQPVEIDLEVDCDLRAAGRSDDLADTIDYGALALLTADVATRGRPNLLEHLAQQIADAVLAADVRIEAVTVRVRKLRPPLAVDLDTTGVVLTRQRAG